MATNRNPFYTVDTYTESFGLDMPKDSVVFCKEDDTIWIVDEDVNLTHSLSSGSKRQLNPGVQSIPTGSVIAMSRSGSIGGFLLCDASIESRDTYSELFAVIGTTYGPGNGSTTFNLPDGRGAFLRMTGQNDSYFKSNGSKFEGGALGSFANDKMQGHIHDFDFNHAIINGVYGAQRFGRSDQSSTTVTTNVKVPKSDGTNGTPRTGNETAPFHWNLNFYIKT